MPRPMPSLEVFKCISKNVLNLRKAKGIGQSELSRMLLVSPHAVYNWEQMISLPSIDCLVRLSRTLGVTMDDLCTKVIDVSEGPGQVQD